MIVVKRLPIETKNTVFGKVYINNEFKGYSLENKKTLIPEGEYKTSKHFGTQWKSGGEKDCLKINGVPNRKAILIHPGNTVINQKTGKYSFRGCIGIGSSFDEKKEFVGNTVNTINGIISQVGYETTIKIINSNIGENMALPLLAIAAPFAKKIGVKLTKKMASKVLDKVKEKTGFEITTKEEAKDALDMMSSKDLKDLEMAALEADKEMFLAELKEGGDLSKSWKDEFVTIAPWCVVFYVITILTTNVALGTSIVDNVVKLMASPFGIILIVISLSAAGLRSVAMKIADGIVKKYL